MHWFFGTIGAFCLFRGADKYDGILLGSTCRAVGRVFAKIVDRIMERCVNVMLRPKVEAVEMAFR
jgi:hypothetical protein